MQKSLLNNSKHFKNVKSYLIPALKGLIYSGILTAAFFLFLWIVQTDVFQVSSLPLTGQTSPYTTQMLFEETGLEAKQEVEFSMPLPEEPTDALLLNPGLSQGVSLYLQETQVYVFPEMDRMDNFSENIFLLKLRELREENEEADTLTIRIKKGGALKLVSPIMTGPFNHLKFLMFLYKFTKDQIFFVMTGLGLLLTFIMLTIAIAGKEKRLLYILIGTYALYFALVYPAIFAFRTDVFLASADYLSKIPSFDFIFSIILLAGIELFAFQRLKLTRYYVIGTLILVVCWFFFGLEFFKFGFEIMSVIFYILVCFLSKKTFFNFILWTNIFQELHDGWLTDYYPYLNHSTYGITFCIVLLGLGTFFINDYKRQKKSLQDKTAELMAANEEMYAMNEELESSYQEIESINAELEERVEQRTEQLKNKNQSLRTLLDNTGEGFCKFSANLLIEPEYSAECEMLFNTPNLAYASFPHLLYPEDKQQREFVQTVLEKAFEEQDHTRRPVFLSLLPEYLQRERRTIELKYQCVFEEKIDKIMMIAKDRTEANRLKKEISQERKTFEKIFKIVTDYKGFSELKTEYTRFFEEGIHRLMGLKDISFPEKKQEIYRITHTFKGNFASYDLQTLVDRLHQAEIAFRDEYTCEEDFRQKLTEYPFSDWLKEEMEQIYTTIDREYFEIAERASDESDFIHTLSKKMEVMPNYPEKEGLMQLIDEYRKQDLKKLFKPLKNLALTTAMRLEKPLETIHIDGDRVEVDPDRFNPLIKSSVHLLRNAIDHGIESVDERIKKDKPLNATVGIHIRKVKNGVEIDFSDDGKGFDKDKITNRAITKGLIKESEGQTLDDQAIFQLTLTEGFSTKRELTDISGFGTGLAAVDKAVQDLDGTLIIHSKKNKGTKITIFIPDVAHSAKTHP